MFTEEKEVELRSIINHYGLINQLDQLIEEAAELIQAANKIKRYSAAPINLKKLAEEAADVKLVTDQLLLFLNLEEEFNDSYKFKLDKTLKKIKE